MVKVCCFGGFLGSGVVWGFWLLILRWDTARGIILILTIYHIKQQRTGELSSARLLIVSMTVPSLGTGGRWLPAMLHLAPQVRVTRPMGLQPDSASAASSKLPFQSALGHSLEMRRMTRMTRMTEKLVRLNSWPCLLTCSSISVFGECLQETVSRLSSKTGLIWYVSA